MTVRRSSATPGETGAPELPCTLIAAQLPEARSAASGKVMSNLFSRHSRTEPSRPDTNRFTASTSNRPSLLPRSSRSSTTISSAGMLPGWLSSSVSTSLAESGASVSRDNLAYTRPAPAPTGWRYSR